MSDDQQDELRRLLDDWQAELDGRNARLPIFMGKDRFAYELEYARVMVLTRCIRELADVLKVPRPA